MCWSETARSDLCSLVNVLDWPLGSAKRIEALRLGAVAAIRCGKVLAGGALGAACIKNAIEVACRPGRALRGSAGWAQRGPPRAPARAAGWECLALTRLAERQNRCPR